MTFIRELPVSNLWRSPELGLAAPRPELADKPFNDTKQKEADRAVPDKTENETVRLHQPLNIYSIHVKRVRLLLALFVYVFMLYLLNKWSRNNV